MGATKGDRFTVFWTYQEISLCMQRAHCRMRTDSENSPNVRRVECGRERGTATSEETTASTGRLRGFPRRRMQGLIILGCRGPKLLDPVLATERLRERSEET